MSKSDEKSRETYKKMDRSHLPNTRYELSVIQKDLVERLFLRCKPLFEFCDVNEEQRDELLRLCDDTLYIVSRIWCCNLLPLFVPEAVPMKHFEEAKEKTYEAIARYTIGILKSRREDLEDAKDLCKEAHKLAPDQIETLTIELYISIALRDFDCVETDLRALYRKGKSRETYDALTNIMHNVMIHYAGTFTDEEKRRYLKLIQNWLKVIPYVSNERMSRNYYLYADYYVYVDYDTLKEYEYLRKLQEIDPLNVTVLISLAQICSRYEIGKFEEGIKYLDEALKATKDDSQIEIIKKNKVNCLLNARRFDECLSLSSEIVNQYPDEITLGNHARCLFELERYEEANECIEKLMLIAENECIYLEAAGIKYALKKYSEAVDLYKNALAFLDSGAMNVAIGDGNISLATPSGWKRTYYEIYDGILKAYFKLNDLISLDVYLHIAKEQFPEKHEWDIWEATLPQIRASKEEIESVKSELLKAREEMSKHKKMTREWALRLMQTQSKSLSLDLDTDDGWKKFEKEIDGIIAEMKDQSKQNEKLYKDTEERIDKQFPNLDITARDFLITAETLYALHKTSSIDFAAIVVEYCKVLEKQLRYLLGDRVDQSEVMLGQLIWLIVDKGISPYNRYKDQFLKINEYRKSSAHVGKLKKKDADEIRNIYFGLGLLQQLK